MTKRKKLISKLDNRKTKKRKAWDLFSKWIRQRDAKNGYISCCSCDKTIRWQDSDAGHFIPKGTGAKGLALEFNEKNVNAQCRGCNRNKGYNKAQIELIKVRYSGFMVKKYGEGIFDELEAQSKTIKGINLDEVIKKYENKN